MNLVYVWCGLRDPTYTIGVHEWWLLFFFIEEKLNKVCDIY